MKAELSRGGPALRILDRFDDEARAFEDRLRARPQTVDGRPWPRVSHAQSYKSLEAGGRRFVVVQAEGERGAYQLAAEERASRLPGLSSGVAAYWTPATEPEAREEQARALEALAEHCRRRTGWLSLRVHAYLPGDAALDAAASLLRAAGFSPCEAQAPERTRLVDLDPPLPEILGRFPGKTRRWLQAPDPAAARIEPLADGRALPALEAALRASFSRSTGEAGAPLGPLFAALERHPESAAALGFFLASDPGTPSAFVSGVSHGPVFEYTAAGSLSSEALRRHPFNYALLWRLIEAAKERGARLFDLGGVTSQEPGDPLAGITHFKRRFPGEELSVGRELELPLRPVRAKVAAALRAVKRALR